MPQRPASLAIQTIIQRAMTISFRRSTSLIFCIGCILLPTAFEQSRAQECSGPGSIVGYATIKDLNLDMQDIVANGTDVGPLEFTLCPMTTFTVVEPLRPLLSNCQFTCGTGVQEEGCIIDGGVEQVVLEGDLVNLRFLGIEFRNFEEKSIAATASANSTALFDRCMWHVSFNIHILPFAP